MASPRHDSRLHTSVIKGSGAAPGDVIVPYAGRQLSGDDLVAQAFSNET